MRIMKEKIRLMEEGSNFGGMKQKLPTCFPHAQPEQHKAIGIPLGLHSLVILFHLLRIVFLSSDPSSFTFPDQTQWTIEGMTVTHTGPKEYHSFQIPITIYSVCPFHPHRLHTIPPSFIHRESTNCFHQPSRLPLSTLFLFHLQLQNTCHSQHHRQYLFGLFPFPIPSHYLSFCSSFH